MTHLTNTQSNVLNYLLNRWEAGESLPSCREIASHFGWTSPRSATDAIEMLKKKGFLAADQTSSRKYRLTTKAHGLPLLGTIPAGSSADALPFDGEQLGVSPAEFGVNKRENAFFLRVKGDSMIGRRIFDGDLVLFEKDVNAHHLSIVAALIDNEVSLKTLIRENHKAWLRSENPDYPDLRPLQKLEIQGVARAVIRQLKP